jgi:hypothetical protein
MTMRLAIAFALSLLAAPTLLVAQDRERAFQFESTVGLDPTSCASERNFSAPAGTTEVVVCLTLANNGLETLYLHQLVSEQLGVLEPAALYTLPAQSSVFYTYAAPVSGTTGLVSRWVSEDLSGRRYCDIAWSVVTLGRAMFGAGPSAGGEIGSGLTCEPESVDR